VPLDGIEALRKAHPEVQVHLYPAHHGFNCDHRAAYNAEAARLARERTLAFLAEYLG
jgi:carboxymethylenebutenolidase